MSNLEVWVRVIRDVLQKFLDKPKTTETEKVEIRRALDATSSMAQEIGRVGEERDDMKRYIDRYFPGGKEDDEQK